MIQIFLNLVGLLLIFAEIFVSGEVVMVPGEQCNRVCRVGDNKVCYFKFILEHYHAMGPACGQCEKGVDADCNKTQCIVGDGFQKGVMSINRLIPGPPIHVCKGDRIVVDVVNMAQGTAAAIHWHGLHMFDTPLMDGVPYLSHCPIVYDSTFRYDFRANQSGTHFYHSHSGHHKLNGQYGALIVREPRAQAINTYEYDFDLPEHYLLISDWRHDYAENSFPGLPKIVSYPESVLINGKGTYIDPDSKSPAIVVPVTRFLVKSGASYRMRIIDSGSLTCAYQIQIANHSMRVIASDSYSVKPISVESIVIQPGERYDVVVEANRGKGDYFIKVAGLESCQAQPTSSYALLRYVNSDDDLKRRQPPLPSYYSTLPTGFRLNHPSAPCFVTNDKEYCAAELIAQEEDYDLITKKPNQTLYLTFTNYIFDNDKLFVPNSYERFDNPEHDITATGIINNISLTLSDKPLYSQYYEIDQSNFCEPSRLPARCKGKPTCNCMYNKKFDLGSTIELVVIDDMPVPFLDHPFHLHGYYFAVMAIGQYSPNRAAEIEKSRNLKRRRPPLKDTVSIPAGGYAVIRFRADNPGFWMFHCHYQMHLQTGMSMIFQVGDIKEMVPVPKGFPKCGSYIPEIK